MHILKIEFDENRSSGKISKSHIKDWHVDFTSISEEAIEYLKLFCHQTTDDELSQTYRLPVARYSPFIVLQVKVKQSTKNMLVVNHNEYTQTKEGLF